MPMACPKKSKALKVLMGELGPAATTRMLEHCRVCGECREAFDFAASTISKTGAASAGPPGRRGRSGDDGSTPEDRRVVWTDSVRRRNRRTIVIFGVVFLALLFAGI